MLCRDGSDSVEATNRYFLLGPLYLIKGVDAAPLLEAALPAELLIKCSLRPILQNNPGKSKGWMGNNELDCLKEIGSGWVGKSQESVSSSPVWLDLERTPRSLSACDIWVSMNQVCFLSLF